MAAVKLKEASLAKVRQALRRRASPRKARVLRGFFKTGKGQYGEGDVFLGVVVPDIRRTVGEYQALLLPAVAKLAASRVHEERLCALLMLVERYKAAGKSERARIFRVYLRLVPHINNWDLVDLTAPSIVGAELWGKSTALLTRLARSKNLWHRRIAVLATFEFIRRGSYSETLRLAGSLLKDEHDLMHKAVGWMLREVGKRHRATLEKFLRAHYRAMPRTMLRYAIERLPEARRQRYLLGTI